MPAKHEPFRNISTQYLTDHPNEILVYGAAFRAEGGGYAKLRTQKNTYAFITKREASLQDDSYYTADGDFETDYQKVFDRQLMLLKESIEKNPDKTFLITKVGSGLANRHHIWERIIKLQLPPALSKYDNVVFLWGD